MTKNEKVPTYASLLFAFSLSVLLCNNKFEIKLIISTYGDFILYIFVNVFSAFLLALSFYNIVSAAITADTAETHKGKIAESVPIARQVIDDGEHPMHNGPEK